MKFETSKKIDKWMENHRKSGCVSHATAGEQDKVSIIAANFFGIPEALASWVRQHETLDGTTNSVRKCKKCREVNG